MQLLKLAQTYNSCTKQGGATKQNPKNFYLNILESCTHIPKDDRLILRKYLSSKKDYDQNNQVVSLLAKYSAKKTKETEDQKLQVALRKLAEKIRKKEQFLLILPKKFDGPKVQIKKDVSINPKKYCNNFQMLKNSIRMPSARRSKSNANSNAVSISKSTEKPKVKLNGLSKQKFQNFQNYQSLAQSVKYLDAYSSLKSSKSYKQMPFPTSRSKFIPKNKKQNKIQKYSVNQDPNLQERVDQNHEQISSYHSIIEVQKPKFTHKHTRSKSLGNLIAQYNERQGIKQVQHIQSNELNVAQNILQPVAQTRIGFQPVPETATTNKISSTFSFQQPNNLHQYSSNQSNSANSTLNNFNAFSFSKSSFASTLQINAKSVHNQLKELKISAQDFLDFLIPAKSKQSRSPTDLSLPYQQFIIKLNQFISLNNPQIRNFCSYETVYIPFYTLYDLVTFEKITQFLEQYAHPKFQNNPVRDLYTRIEIGVCGISHFVSSHKRISVQQFKKSYEWKRPSVRVKFEELVRRCSRWGTCITYWELYWLKDCPEYKLFQKQFNFD